MYDNVPSTVPTFWDGKPSLNVFSVYRVPLFIFSAVSANAAVQPEDAECVRNRCRSSPVLLDSGRVKEKYITGTSHGPYEWCLNSNPLGPNAETFLAVHVQQTIPHMSSLVFMPVI